MAEPNRTPSGADVPNPAEPDPDRPGRTTGEDPAGSEAGSSSPDTLTPDATRPAHVAEPTASDRPRRADSAEGPRSEPSAITEPAAAEPPEGTVIDAPVQDQTVDAATRPVETAAAPTDGGSTRRVQPAFSNSRVDRAAPAADELSAEATPAEAANTSVADEPSSSSTAPPIPPAPATQPVLRPAEEPVAAPKRGGNRIAGTAWVLLAAGLFEVLYLASIALVVLLLGGAQAVVPQLVPFASSPFAWLPVLLFFLFFELTVLLINRAGRFAYVVASLVVGLLIYVLSVLLISIMLGGGLSDRLTLARAFESPEFILAGLVAREVMLWTGFAIGARGTRVRKRNRAAKDAYRQELAERSDATR